MQFMVMDIIKPVLIIGVGGAGSEIATNINQQFDSECLLISTHDKDLNKDVSRSVKITTDQIINPSINTIKSSTYRANNKIKDIIIGYKTIIIVANLSGKNGNGIAPTISQICRNENKNLISLIIMPFKFEKSRLFISSISLKHLKRDSDCMIIFDNNALLDSNPNLTKSECHEISVDTMDKIIQLLKSPELSKNTNLVTTSKYANDFELMLKDSLKMLYQNVEPANVNKTILHVLLSNNAKLGEVNRISNIIENIYNCSNIVSTSYSKSLNRSKVILIASIKNNYKMNFNKYDPLEAIPYNNEVDCNEMEYNINCKLPSLYQLE